MFTRSIERLERSIVNSIGSYPPDPDENSVIAEQRIKIDVRTQLLRFSIGLNVALFILCNTLVLHLLGAI